MGALGRSDAAFFGAHAFPATLPKQGMMGRIGFGILVVYLFALWSRLQDYVSGLHAPAMLLGLLILATLLSGGGAVLFRVPFGRCLSLFTVWMALSIPFSTWVGGSVHFFYNDWLRAFIVGIAVVSLVRETRQAKTAIWALSIGAAITSITALIASNSVIGRLEGADTRFSDSNDLAQFVIVGMCLWAMQLEGGPGRLLAIRVFAALMIGGMAVVFLRTGSRGGLLGAVVVVIELFRQAPLFGKLRIGAILLVVGVVGVALTPRDVTNRYLSMFTSDVDYGDANSGIAARGSADSREYLLRQSLSLTMQHPLLGVGPGMFMVAEDDVARARGARRGDWHETHNLYTQVSSECGIPALVIYLGAWYFSFRGLNRVLKAARSSADPWLIDAGKTAFWLRMMLVATAASGFFLSVAYMPELQAILGLSVAFAAAFERERAARTGTVRTMTPAPISLSASSQAPIGAHGGSVPAMAGPGAVFAGHANPVLRRPPRYPSRVRT
jgi:hypothetical protein